MKRRLLRIGCLANNFLFFWKIRFSACQNLRELQLVKTDADGFKWTMIYPQKFI